MMKQVLIAGVLALGAMGLAGTALAAPCQNGNAPTGTYYNVCLLNETNNNYSFGGNYGCGSYSYKASSVTDTPAGASASQFPVGSAGAGVSQSRGTSHYQNQANCNYGFYSYKDNYVSDSASKYTSAGGSAGLPLGFVYVNAGQSVGSYSYSDVYSSTQCFFGCYSYSSTSKGSGAYHDTGVNSALYTPAPVGINAGVNQRDESFSSSYVYSGSFGSGSYSSTSYNKDLLATANAGPVGVTAGHANNGYSANSNGYKYGSSVNSVGATVNSPAGSQFTGEKSVNGGPCFVYVAGQNAGPCPVDVAMVPDAPDVPEVPDFPAPPL